MLEDFLDRFDERFGVPAQEPESAYRPTAPQMCMDTVLCFRHSRRVARDNTVEYRWRALQLLPGKEQPTYAGLKMDVLKGLDGQLVVEHGGRVIPSQETRPDRMSCSVSLDNLPMHRRTVTARVVAGRRSWRHSTGRE